MKLNILRMLIMIVMMSGFVSSYVACNSSADKKTAKEASVDVAVASDVKAENKATKLDEAGILQKMKELYVCPRINMTIAEAESEGALCPDKKRMIELTSKMVNGTLSEGDIMHLIKNYKIQGKSMVSDNGTVACGVSGKLKNELFLMSYCPYGVKYVSNTLHPMIDDLGASLDWKPYYIMQKTKDGFSSMHGKKEVDENMRQICIRDKWGPETWLSYVDCFSEEIYAKSRGGNPKSWQYCAEQSGIKTDELQKCAEEEAPALAEKDIEYSNKYGARGSPTAVFNCNKNIVGAMPYSSVKARLCKMIDGKVPENCTN